MATFTKDHFPSAQERGLFSIDQRLLFLSPENEVIKRMTEKDHRIVYFPLSIPSEDMDTITINDHPEKFARWSGGRKQLPSLFDTTEIDYLNGNEKPAINSVGAAVNLANWYLLKPNLERWLDNEFNQDEIMIRGTACLIDENEKNEFSNPLEILENGAEQTRATHIGLTGFNGEIGHRTNQWLFDHPQGIRSDLIEAGDIETAEKIFPVLLVYNSSMFNQEGSSYNTVMPTNPSLRRRLIKQLIILDFPLSRNMISDLK